MLIEIVTTEMTADERAVLRLFFEYEGQRLSAEDLSERALMKPMSDDGRAMNDLLASLSAKLQMSGYTINKVETLLADSKIPGISFEYEDYVLEAADSQSRM